MQKQEFYQLASTGKVKVWNIEVINRGTYSEILTNSGLEGGAMTANATHIDAGKNTGKANATDHYAQACAEAQSKIKLKTRAGYVEDRTQVKSQTVLGSGVPQPMLAHKYDPTKKQGSSKDLKQIGIEGKEIFTQRKKDGNRCLIKVTKTTVSMHTRKGDPFPDMPHISLSILKSFQKIYDYVNRKYGVTEYWLDGELYTKAYSFNKLNGLATKKDRTIVDEIDVQKIKYHIYDVILDAGYETRMKIINYFLSPTVHVEQTERLIATEANLKKQLEKYLAEGEEGLMIRLPGKGYENKRTWQLTKYKVNEDKEFKILRFEESVKKGMAGAVWVEHDVKGAVDRDGNPITEFKAGMSMDHETCTEIWNNQHKYIGKQMTVEFFGRSEYTVPRFTKAKAIRD